MAIEAGYPNTGTNIAGHKTSSGLSTQIIIKVFNVPVGALQELSVSQKRPLKRQVEIGTDGCIEIVPNGITTFDLSVKRIVFDQLRLPEGFSRGFRFINAQTIPFDIEVIDLSGCDANATFSENDQTQNVMVYKNCWFASYDTPYQASDYIITESATLYCETAYELRAGRHDKPITPQTDKGGVESSVNKGDRLGSLDALGLINAMFNEEKAL